MKEWKARQKAYHATTTDFDDDLNKVIVEYDRHDSVVDDVLDYINKSPDDIGWLYPAKSYLVAICYATWLEEDFGDDFYSLLDDKDLLYGNDPCFVRYNQAQSTYDKILNELGNRLPMTGVVPDIKEYYQKEFIICPDL
jgi:hypothetical protein